MTSEELNCLMSAIIFSSGKLSMEESCERALIIRAIQKPKSMGYDEMKSCDKAISHEDEYVSKELFGVLLTLPYLDEILEYIRRNRSVTKPPMTVTEFRHLTDEEIKSALWKDSSKFSIFKQARTKRELSLV
jgi:hypothetical protein